MPLIDFTYQQGSLEADAIQGLLGDILSTVRTHEAIKDDDHGQFISWAYAHELPTTHVRVEYPQFDRPIYRVDLTVPSGSAIHGEGPWAYDRRRKIAREVTQLVLEAEGTEYSYADAARVWVLMHEIRDTFWAMAGRIFRFEDLVSYMAPDQVQTPVGRHMREAADHAMRLTPAGAGRSS
jgi:phenylpyruvate tautomerase PptA (4-oxalocrotonate tautomerase family)